jgi:hypothetical protein
MVPVAVSEMKSASPRQPSTMDIFLRWRLDEALLEVRTGWGRYFARLREAGEVIEVEQEGASRKDAFGRVLRGWRTVVVLAGVCTEWRRRCTVWMTAELPEQLKKTCWRQLLSGWMHPMTYDEKLMCASCAVRNFSVDVANNDLNRSCVKDFLVLTTVKVIWCRNDERNGPLKQFMEVIRLSLRPELELTILHHLFATMPLHLWVNCPRDDFAEFVAMARVYELELVFNTVLEANGVKNLTSSELTCNILGSFVGSWVGEDLLHFFQAAVKASLEDNALCLLKHMCKAIGWPPDRWIREMLESSVGNSCWQVALAILEDDCCDASLNPSFKKTMRNTTGTDLHDGEGSAQQRHSLTSEEYYERQYWEGHEIQLLESWLSKSNCEDDNNDASPELAVRLALRVCTTKGPIELIEALSRNRGHLLSDDGSVQFGCRDWRALWNASIEQDRSDVARLVLRRVTRYHLSRSVPRVGLERACGTSCLFYCGTFAGRTE